ncbi:MAG: ferredoxin [Polyangiaceae bacterium]|nr:ferredoxin [Polyangiaceae bacterium]MCL4755099.1 ferredoxin [Myxococcales bacterium]
MGDRKKSQRACRGGVALELTEKTLCGPGAVLTAAAAEGLALSGVRAARLLADEDARPGNQAGAAVPWVLHRTTSQRGRGGAFGAFELVAGSAREAVDQCLVAHLTGLCGDLLVDPGFSQRLQLFEPLDAAVTAPLLEEAADGEHLVVDDEGVARELGAAFAKASEGLGRAVASLSVEQSGDAEMVLITTADARDLAAEAAHALGKCAAIAIAQLRPFPAAAVAEAARGKRVVVLEPSWARGRLENAVRSALASDGAPLPVIDPFAPNLRATLRATLGLGHAPADSLRPEPPRFVIGVAPAGPRSEALLGDLAARLAEVGQISIAEPEGSGEAVSLLAIGGSRVSSRPAIAADLLFVADPVLLSASKLAERLARGGSLVIASTAATPDAVWGELSAVQREALRGLGVRVLWLDSAKSRASEADLPRAAWLTLERALLESAAPGLSERLGLDERRISALAGEPVLQRVEPTPSVAAHAPRQLPERPVLPAKADKPDARWRAGLRRFHVTGQGAAGPTALLPLAPAAVSAWLAGAPARETLLLVDEGAEQLVTPLDARLEAALGGERGVVAEHLARLVSDVAAELAEAGGAAPVSAALERGLARFAAEFELSAAAKKSFDAELAAFRQALPKSGTLLGLSSHTHLRLYASVVLAERERRAAGFLREVESVASGLAERLRLEASRSPAARSAEGLSAVLGEGVSFVDPAALAKALPKARGPQPLAEARRRRMQAALGLLQRFLNDAPKSAKLTIVHSGSVPDELDLGRVERVRHTDCFEVAAGLFDGLAKRLAEVFRAMRVGRLELDGAYDPAVHDEGLESLEWRGFSQEELLLVPPVVVVESAERVWRSSLDALSRLLRSGRPIHALIEESASLSGQPGLGYVLVAHREALVVQGSLARPLHLAEGFSRTARSLRPAVVVVAPRPASGPIPAWLAQGAALEGRALPAFSYDPDAGASWAECFDIRDNPAPEEPWPTRKLEVDGADGKPESLELAFTFADAAALDVNLRAHFWPIPAEAWSDDQVELGRYVSIPPAEALQRLPFIWVLGDDGRLARAVVSRELAFACRERLRIWHVVQELGGSANEHARRAAERARREAEAEAAARLGELEAAHSRELERVRTEEAAEALSRLAQALLDPGALLATPTAPATARAAPSPASAPAPEPVAPTPAAAAPAAEEEAVSFTDPYIDTPLCTSCNECVNLNGLMFKYNGDKQAILADAKAGTYLQLVTAAEKCPAACIHPGAPRADDKTVTEDLVARAARFN